MLFFMNIVILSVVVNLGNFAIGWYFDTKTFKEY